ncbi:MAG: VTT domain-containing protein [Bacteroidetes bacterium]|nr:VTT domain-containing protein [Fibrella sp.]
MTILPLLFSSYVTFYAIAHETTLQQFTGWQWALATAVCCLTSTVALTPPTLLALVFGYFLGWNALLPLFALNMVAILLVNLLVQWVDQDRLLNYLEQNPKVQSVLERIRRQELKFIFFTKLSPVLPFAITNLVFALSGVRLVTILLGGFLGMVPRTVLAVVTGSQAREIRTLLENPNQANWAQVALVLLLIASVAGLISIFTRRVT